MFNRFTNLSAQPAFRYAAALFVFSLAVNLACFNWAEAPITYPDSHGYIEPATQLKQGQFPDFSLRSPTYPVYLFFTGLFAQIINRSPLKLAVCGQIVFGAVAIVLLYLIALKLLRSPSLASGVSALLALNFQVIDYQSTVLTESLATTLLLAVLYAHIAAIGERITLNRLLGMLIVDSLLVMLRPNFILLPMSLYILHIIYLLAMSRITASRLRYASPSSFLLAFGILCNVGLVASLTGLYYLQMGHFGLSKTSEFNRLGKVIQYGYFDQNSVNPPRIAQRAQEIYRELERNRDPYNVINRLKREGLYSMENLRTINSYFLAGHKVDFTIQTARVMSDVLTKKAPFHYGRPDGLSRSLWLHSMSRPINPLHAFNGKAVLFACGFALYLLVKNRRDQSMALIMILSTVFYHLVTITAFGYSEYSRLRVPIDLLLNLLVLLPFLLVALYVGRRLKLAVAKSLGGSSLGQPGHETSFH